MSVLWHWSGRRRHVGIKGTNGSKNLFCLTFVHLVREAVTRYKVVWTFGFGYSRAVSWRIPAATAGRVRGQRGYPLLSGEVSTCVNLGLLGHTQKRLAASLANLMHVPTVFFLSRRVALPTARSLVSGVSNVSCNGQCEGTFLTRTGQPVALSLVTEAVIGGEWTKEASCFLWIVRGSCGEGYSH